MCILNRSIIYQSLFILSILHLLLAGDVTTIPYCKTLGSDLDTCAECYDEYTMVKLQSDSSKYRCSDVTNCSIVDDSNVC